MAVWNDSSELYQFAKEIVSRLQRSGHIAYFAGGCVRDACMGNAPHDYDVATSARLEQVIALFGPKNTLAIGAAFGVACVHRRIGGTRYQVEIATFRSDGTYSDGRHPDWVQFSRPEEDAQRRDFTINGMFYDPIAEELKDFVGGAIDLAAKRIRAIGQADHRIDEDKLRMLRAVRFGARFGFEIDRETADAIKRHANEILVVSGERIAAEMLKLFESPKRGWGISELYGLGLLAPLWPELDGRWREDDARRERGMRCLSRFQPEHDGDSSMSASVALLWLCSQSEPTRGVPQSEAAEILGAIQARWKLSNRVTEQAIFAMSHVDAIRSGDQLPWSQIQPILIAEHAPLAVEVAGTLVAEEALDGRGISFCRDALRWPAEELNPAPHLTGRDLHALGLRPGPRFAELLRKARSMQLDGYHGNRDEALEWLRHQPES
ncbi:CCA-adding enzyme [Pirellula sp. SH-Sr6A]|uniref:CCA tRNA nucleotidyltransferase n=1 Tax=Pirellula sp. SH-Sr6A TaxID=1632865 RepID=UPI00078E5A46|nr:CCA tRNA nucleotidyltransferase [Pirellula sp. SH-Sr6A]AMV33093.1 CCA-adding enzyme [Pirellula sp. SH-Sr6A]